MNPNDPHYDPRWDVAEPVNDDSEGEGDETSASGLTQYLKKYPALWVVVVVVPLLVVGGIAWLLLGKEPEPVRPPRPASSGPSIPPPVAGPRPNVPNGTAKNDEDGKAGAPGKPKQEALPEDVSKWVRDDYLRARKEGSRLLAPAIAHLGQRFAGDPKADAAATLLGDLLKPEPAEDTPPALTAPGRPQPPQPRRVNLNLGKPVVDALVANGSGKAREILCDLVAGTFPTDNDKMTAEAAVTALSRMPCPETEDFLFRLSTAPEGVRPMGQGQVLPEELQKKAFPILTAMASEATRRRLAEFAVQDACAPPQRETIIRYLLQAAPENVAGQMVLYNYELLPAANRTMLENQFLQFGSRVTAGLLRVPAEAIGTGMVTAPTYTPGAAGVTIADKISDEELPYRLAKYFWNKEFREKLAERFQNLESLQKEATLIALAGTIPLDVQRSSLLECLASHHSEGPRSLKAALDRACCDPGLLVVFKSLPRKHPEPKELAPKRPVSPRPGSSARPKAIRPLTPATPDANDKLEREWNDACEDLARSICRRLQAAAKMKRITAKDGDKPVDPAAKRPFELHKDGKVMAEYHFDWPEDLPDKTKLGDVPTEPMQVHYVRVQGRSKLKPVESHYRLKASSREAYDVRDGLWMESCRKVEKSDRKTSIDVLINCPRQGPVGPAKSGSDRDEEEVPYTIDILYVQIKDPALAAEAK